MEKEQGPQDLQEDIVRRLGEIQEQLKVVEENSRKNIERWIENKEFDKIRSYVQSVEEVMKLFASLAKLNHESLEGDFKDFSYEIKKSYFKLKDDLERIGYEASSDS